MTHSPTRNLWVLSVAQFFAISGTTIFFTYGGLIGADLAPRAGLSTLPLALAIVGTALSSLPAALVMQRVGRRSAFMISATFASIAALYCAYSIAHHDFTGYCIAALLFGANMAFVQQYRFAAIELLTPDQATRAITSIMIATLIAVIVWPEVGSRVRLMGGLPEFTGTFIVVAALYWIAIAILTALPPMTTTKHDQASSSRSLWQTINNTRILVAILAGICSYGVMSFIMVATPISMHMLDEMSVEQTKQVISLHLVAMYLPSLFSSWLVRTFGHRLLMLVGVICMSICVAMSLILGHHFMHYLSALALLGIGWNLLFVSGTTLLTSSYAPSDRFRVQGLNDMMVFGTQALVSVASGPVLLILGWEQLNLLSIPLLLLMLLGIVWLWMKDVELKSPSTRLST
jgi:MFS family permease